MAEPSLQVARQHGRCLRACRRAAGGQVEQGQTQKDAVKAVSAETGVKKNALYRYVLDHEE